MEITQKQERNPPKRYYIENVERGPVGNCIQWWRMGDNGYTCHIRDAATFSFKKARDLCNQRDRKYKMWETSIIDDAATLQVDMQKIRRHR